MSAGGKETLTIEKATVPYLKGELSRDEYVEIIRNNPNRPDYEKLAENPAKLPPSKTK